MDAIAAPAVTSDGSSGAVESPMSKRPRTGSAPIEAAGTELARGAEGLVVRVTYLGRSAVRKTRAPKRYRHPELDAKLTARRLAQEARALLRLRRAGVRVPALYAVEAARSAVVMGFVDGQVLKDVLRAAGEENVAATAAMGAAGREVRKMHDAGFVHGDLTTSNMIVVAECEVVLIDFGLSSTSGTDEDKAVDLYVLERAVVAAHPERSVALNAVFFDAYFGGGAGAEAASPVALRLDDVRSRGRKRDMIG
jgi:TP53 regulating kinase and related kinases